MIQIHCIDASNGRLFYIPALLNSLSTHYRILFEIPTALKKNYGNFFDLFPKIEIVNKSDISKESKLNIIFSDYSNIESFLKNKNTLIYSIIFSHEFEKYSKLYSNNEKRVNLIPVKIQGNIYIPATEWVLDYIQKKFYQVPLENKKILISAGPTVEDIDPVRFLTNRSTGKMGIALARAAFVLGADVDLVLGPTSETAPEYVSIHRVRSAEEMASAVLNHFKNCDLYLGSAAVADFTPVHYKDQKIKKINGLLELPLKRTTDILNKLSEQKDKQIVVGFSVETNSEIENSQIKLIKKNLDMIVVNNPLEKGSAFAADTNLVTILTRDGSVIKLPLQSKFEVSLKIFSLIFNINSTSSNG